MSLIIDGVEHHVKNTLHVSGEIRYEFPSMQGTFQLSGLPKTLSMRKVIKKFAAVKKVNPAIIRIQDHDDDDMDQPLSSFDFPLTLVTLAPLTKAQWKKSIQSAQFYQCSYPDLESYRELPDVLKLPILGVFEERKEVTVAVPETDEDDDKVAFLRGLLNLYHQMKTLGTTFLPKRINIKNFVLVDGTLKFTPSTGSEYGPNRSLEVLFTRLICEEYPKIWNRPEFIRKDVPWFAIVSRDPFNPCHVSISQPIEVVEEEEYERRWNGSFTLPLSKPMPPIVKRWDVPPREIRELGTVVRISQRCFSPSLTEWSFCVLKTFGVGATIVHNCSPLYAYLPLEQRVEVLAAYNATTLCVRMPSETYASAIPRRENMIYALRNLYWIMDKRFAPTSLDDFVMDGFTLKMCPTIQSHGRDTKAAFEQLLSGNASECALFFLPPPYNVHEFSNPKSTNLLDYTPESPREKAKRLREQEKPTVDSRSNQEKLAEYADLIPKKKKKQNRPQPPTPRHNIWKKARKGDNVTEEEHEVILSDLLRYKATQDDTLKALEEELQRMAGRVVKRDHPRNTDMIYNLDEEEHRQQIEEEEEYSDL